MIKSPACRQEGETEQDCVSRKIPEILDENPDMSQEQATAIAYSVCQKPCKEKKMTRQFISKMIGMPITKVADTVGSDDSFRVRGFFTSDQKDEVGDVITREATLKAIPKYRQWGNVRYMHQPRPVGKVTAIGEEDGLEWNEIEIEVVDPDTKFEVENGLLKALSVGIFIRNFEDVEFTDDGLIINDYSLAEISLVDHPANYDAALQTNNYSLPMSEVMRLGTEHLQVITKTLNATTAGIFIDDEPQVEETSSEKAATDDAEVVDEVLNTAEEEVLATEKVEPVVDITEETEPVVEETEPIVEEEATVNKEMTETIEENENNSAEDASETTSADLSHEILEAIRQFSSMLTEIRELITSMAEVKMSAEVPEAQSDITEEEEIVSNDESVETSELKARVAELEQKNKELIAQVEDLNSPASPTIRGVATELPHEIKVEPSEEKGDLLTDALKNYFNGKSGGIKFTPRK